MTCKSGNHSLIVILSSNHWDCDEVVRWCKKCGAVVVDVEVDGRVQPGRVMPMKFPKR
jgi:hypothetical protein